jgi:5-methylcytosine-specific restriction endonuclease McrA
LAVSGGDNYAATCTSCHVDAHAILPASNPESRVYHTNLPETCGQCHSKGKLPLAENSNINTAFDFYTDSIHGRATMKSGLQVSANCSDCHGSHDIQPLSNPNSPINPDNVADDCGKCHVDVARDWKASSHGQAAIADISSAPVCTTCHVAHSVTHVDEPKAVNALMTACSTCHKTEFGTYRDTFHGKVTQIGDLRTATCSSCHGAHLVLPAGDPRSSTSPDRLVSTCQNCHPSATAQFTNYQPHAEPRDAAKYPSLHATWVLMTVLLAGVFGFFGIHTLLWFFRSLRNGKRFRNEEIRDVR